MTRYDVQRIRKSFVDNEYGINVRDNSNGSFYKHVWRLESNLALFDNTRSNLRDPLASTDLKHRRNHFSRGQLFERQLLDNIDGNREVTCTRAVSTLLKRDDSEAHDIFQ